MSIVQNDVKQTLRKKEFPFSARVGLTKAEDLLSSSTNSSGVQMIKQSELAMEIIAEFVFNEVDRKGFRKKLTPLQELELMEVVCDHLMFDWGGNETSRPTLFLLLFPSALPDRVKYLVMLVSLAISIRSVTVLEAAGFLIQQAGPSSSYCNLFVRGLISEHFLLVDSSCPSIADLPRIAPTFTVNLLAAATEAYKFSERKEEFQSPPNHFLETVVGWLSGGCGVEPVIWLLPKIPWSASRIFPVRGGFLSQPLVPLVLTGLLEWSVYSFLLKSPVDGCGLNKVVGDRLPLYNRLESSLLGCLSNMSCVDRGLIKSSSLSSIVVQLRKLSSPPSSSKSIDDAVHSLAIAIQTFSKMGNLNGPKKEMWFYLCEMPIEKLCTLILDEKTNLGFD